MKYTKIPTNTIDQIQLNAGILVDSFDVETGTYGNILGATSGGVEFSDRIETSDFGEDIDNCPKNMKELKVLESHEVTMSGTFVTVSATSALLLAGAADIDGSDSSHVVPRNDFLVEDFKDFWWCGDYSKINTGENAGFIAVHMMNALNTGGFHIQSGDREKGQFAFEFTGHYSINEQDVVPYELYVRGESSESSPAVMLSTHAAKITAGDRFSLSAKTIPAGKTVTWTSGSSSVATVSNGLVTAVAAGNTIITAAITVDGVTYNDTCTVVVTAS